MIDLRVDLPGLHLKNPVIPASGCFGFGQGFPHRHARLDAAALGGLVFGEHDAVPLIGVPAHRDISVPQCGIFHTFHRCVKIVQVGMQN